MKNFNLFPLCVAALLVFLFSCNEEEIKTESTPSDRTTLTFGIALQDLLNVGSRGENDFSDFPECSDNDPAKVHITLSLDGADFPAIILDVLSDDLDNDGDTEFYTDYSEELELLPDNYQLEEFIIYDTNNEILWIAPKNEEGEGNYYGYVNNLLPITVDLTAGVKKYVEVEVLCFDDRVANTYGYQFFDLIPNRLYEFCLAANLCLNGEVYMANYSLELFYVRNAGEDILLYPQETLVTPELGRNEDNEFYAKPVCVIIPSPQYGEADDEEYLYFQLTLLDWPENYGDIEDGEVVQGGYLTWEMIEILRNTDDDTSTEDDDLRFLQFFLNCGPGGGDCIPTPTDSDGNCIPDSVQQMGYAFFDLQEKELIEFCLFGNFCTSNGRHYVASYSVDVWSYSEGEISSQLYDDLFAPVTMIDGEYSADPLCVLLPDGSGTDEFFVEITIYGTDEYGATEEIIRSGVITDNDIRGLFEGENNLNYLHFFEGCNEGDSPPLFDDYQY
ncbi:hypothetical protein RM545_04535 [Zunongwangia sp. F260]|uniref:Uncharacterized protein n=1 Tax=Autumnicola lenta TaxID=3075593 RepID=A0ABU3CHX5_9FLAO|nr:hypothetical protein [Zunongwangia sp. F260]MDT0645947.1 hypothetical protein [Zunongwangia sp. F260]